MASSGTDVSPVAVFGVTPVTRPLELIRRRWLLITACVLLGLGLAALYSASPAVYTSTGVVLVTPTGVDDATQPINGQGARAEVNMETEAQLVKSTGVASEAGKLLGSSSEIGTLLRSVTVNVPQNTAVLEISFRAGSGQQAADGAQAFAVAYLENRRQVAESRLTTAIGSLQTELDAVQSELQAATARRDSAPADSPEAAFANAEVDISTAQLGTLSQALSTLTTTSVTPGRVVNEASVPQTADALGLPAILVGGLLGGLALGIALGFVRDRTDRRVRRATQLSRLGVRAFDVMNDRLATREPPDSVAGRAIRHVHNSLSVELAAGKRAVLVCAVGPDDVSDRMAANIAVVAARSDSTVCLVLTGPDSGAAEHLLGRASGPGLAEVLTGAQHLDHVQHEVPGERGLRVILAGVGTEQLSDKLRGTAILTAVQSLRASFEYVIVQTASATSSADATSVARVADAAIVVAQSGETRIDDVLAVSRDLAEMKLHRLWCAVVPPQPTRMPPSPPAQPEPDRRVQAAPRSTESATRPRA